MADPVDRSVEDHQHRRCDIPWERPKQAPQITYSGGAGGTNRDDRERGGHGAVYANSATAAIAARPSNVQIVMTP